MKRTGTFLICVGTIILVVWFQTIWRREPAVQVVFEGVKSISYGKGTNQQAVFRILNPGTATVYYEGTPYPAYILEQKAASDWIPDGHLPEPEVLCAIFPGKNYRFTIPCPKTSNTWRLAVSVVSPSRAPLLLRKYFKPRHIICRSMEIPPIPEEDAGGGDGGSALQTSNAVR